MLIDKLNQEIIKEYKSGKPERRIFLQTLKAALLNKSKELKDKFDEKEEIKVLKSELKQREQALSQFKAGKREDLIQKTECEISMLKNFLPQELSEEKIKEIVTQKFQEASDKSFGNIMKVVMKELGGRADGKIVARIVKELT